MRRRQVDGAKRYEQSVSWNVINESQCSFEDLTTMHLITCI